LISRFSKTIPSAGNFGELQRASSSGDIPTSQSRELWGAIAPDNTDIFDETGEPQRRCGLYKLDHDHARQIQFALKVIW